MDNYFVTVLLLAALSCVGNTALIKNRGILMKLQPISDSTFEKVSANKINIENPPISHLKTKRATPVHPCVKWDPLNTSSLPKGSTDDIECVPLDDTNRDTVLQAMNALEQLETSSEEKNDQNSEADYTEISMEKAPEINKQTAKPLADNKDDDINVISKESDDDYDDEKLFEPSPSPTSNFVESDKDNTTLKSLQISNGAELDSIKNNKEQEEADVFFDKGQFNIKVSTPISKLHTENPITTPININKDDKLENITQMVKVTDKKDLVTSPESIISVVESLDVKKKVSASIIIDEDKSLINTSERPKLEKKVVFGKPKQIETTRIISFETTLSKEIIIINKEITTENTKKLVSEENIGSVDSNISEKLLTTLPDSDSDISNNFLANNVAFAPGVVQSVKEKSSELPHETVRVSSIVAGWAAGFFGTFMIIAFLAAYCKSVERKRNKNRLNQTDLTNLSNLSEDDFIETVELTKV